MVFPGKAFRVIGPAVGSSGGGGAYTSTTTSASRSREVLDGLHHLVILFDFFVGRIADLSNRQLEFQKFAANFRIKHWWGWVGLPVRQQVALLCMSFLLPDKVT